MPDRPGYDGTPAGGFAWNAAALASQLDLTDVARVVIVGHSWGGGGAAASETRNGDTSMRGPRAASPGSHGWSAPGAGQLT